MEAFDVLIVGSGLAGQSLALRLADHLRVVLVTKRQLMDAASAWAQGGIAAVLDDGLRTKDILSPGMTEVGTVAMGDAIIAKYLALSA